LPQPKKFPFFASRPVRSLVASFPYGNDFMHRQQSCFFQTDEMLGMARQNQTLFWHAFCFSID
jgi:hypothetical protein